ncbi:unnamed protein product [Cyprideis torosa]|uniref:Cep192-like domain-containing protein n=1 Tax=Cyprideis torosa TaxID=163714 RepID=A0A7R8W6C2_9CRUS|nr:unnamed protein product [Cyprideis torosa]CAG0886347.1 unnamed protein product [Cyprideis torosa]
MATFKPTEIKVFPGAEAKASTETAYWKRLGNPVLIQDSGQIDFIHFSPVEPHYFAATSSAKVQIFHSQRTQVFKTLSRFTSGAFGGRFRSDGKLICCGSEEKQVKLFNLSTKTILRIFKGHTAPVRRVDFSCDGLKIVSFSDDQTVRVWDLADEKEQGTYESHSDFIRAGVCHLSSPDLFLSGGYDGTCVLSSFSHGSPVECLSLVPSGGGTLLASAGGTEIHIWDLLQSRSNSGSGKPLVTLSHHHKTITCLSVVGGVRSSRDTRLLSGSLDRHVKIYDITDYSVVHSLTYPSPVLSLGVAENAELSPLVVGMTDGVISIRHRGKGRETLPPGLSVRRKREMERKAERNRKYLSDGRASDRVRWLSVPRFTRAVLDLATVLVEAYSDEVLDSEAVYGEFLLLKKALAYELRTQEMLMQVSGMIGFITQTHRLTHEEHKRTMLVPGDDSLQDVSASCIHLQQEMSDSDSEDLSMDLISLSKSADDSAHFLTSPTPPDPRSAAHKKTQTVAYEEAGLVPPPDLLLPPAAEDPLREQPKSHRPSQLASQLNLQPHLASQRNRQSRSVSQLNHHQSQSASQLNRQSQPASQLNRQSQSASQLNRQSQSASQLNRQSQSASQLNRQSQSASQLNRQSQSASLLSGQFQLSVPRQSSSIGREKSEPSSVGRKQQSVSVGSNDSSEPPPHSELNSFEPLDSSSPCKKPWKHGAQDSHQAHPVDPFDVSYFEASLRTGVNPFDSREEEEAADGPLISLPSSSSTNVPGGSVVWQPISPSRVNLPEDEFQEPEAAIPSQMERSFPHSSFSEPGVPNCRGRLSEIDELEEQEQGQANELDEEEEQGQANELELRSSAARTVPPPEESEESMSLEPNDVSGYMRSRSAASPNGLWANESLDWDGKIAMLRRMAASRANSDDGSGAENSNSSTLEGDDEQSGESTADEVQLAEEEDEVAAIASLTFDAGFTPVQLAEEEDEVAAIASLTFDAGFTPEVVAKDLHRLNPRRPQPSVMSTIGMTTIRDVLESATPGLSPATMAGRVLNARKTSKDSSHSSAASSDGLSTRSPSVTSSSSTIDDYYFRPDGGTTRPDFDRSSDSFLEEGGACGGPEGFSRSPGSPPLAAFPIQAYCDPVVGFPGVEVDSIVYLQALALDDVIQVSLGACSGGLSVVPPPHPLVVCGSTPTPLKVAMISSALGRAEGSVSFSYVVGGRRYVQRADVPVYIVEPQVEVSPGSLRFGALSEGMRAVQSFSLCYPQPGSMCVHLRIESRFPFVHLLPHPHAVDPETEERNPDDHVLSLILAPRQSTTVQLGCIVPIIPKLQEQGEMVLTGRVLVEALDSVDPRGFRVIGHIPFDAHLLATTLEGPKEVRISSKKGAEKVRVLNRGMAHVQFEATLSSPLFGVRGLPEAFSLSPGKEVVFEVIVLDKRAEEATLSLMSLPASSQSVPRLLWSAPVCKVLHQSVIRTSHDVLSFGAFGEKLLTCVAKVRGRVEMVCSLDRGMEFKERRPPYRLSSSSFRVDLHQGSDHQTFIRFASSTLGLCSDRLILRCRADGHPPSKYAVELHGIPRSFDLVAIVRNPFRGGSAEVGQIFVDVVNNGKGIAFCHALVFEDESCSLVARGLSLEPRHCLLRPRETATFIVTPPPPSHGDPSSLLSSATLFLLSGEEIARQEFKRSLAAAGRPVETSPDLRRARLEPPSILGQFEIMRGSSSSPCLLPPPESSLKALSVSVAADILAEGLTGLKQILFNPDDVLKTLDTLDDTIVP